MLRERERERERDREIKYSDINHKKNEWPVGYSDKSLEVWGRRRIRSSSKRAFVLEKFSGAVWSIEEFLLLFSLFFFIVEFFLKIDI